MKDIITPVPQEEVKAVIHSCLEQAALVNYQRLSEYAKLEGEYFEVLQDWPLEYHWWYWYYFNILISVGLNDYPVINGAVDTHT